jgi:DNA-directed RNA polymerase specialized sigma24 family protein
MAILEQRVAADLARRRTDRRDRVERLLALSEHLPPSDRLLLRQVFERGNTVADIARLAGTCPRKLRRRLRALIRRTRDPLFRHFILHQDLLPPPARRSVQLHILQGKSLRAAADLTGHSLHQVRQHLLIARTLAGIATAAAV